MLLLALSFSERSSGFRLLSDTPEASYFTLFAIELSF